MRPLLRAIFHEHGFEGFPCTLVEAPICRPELLCETEAVAVLRLPGLARSAVRNKAARLGVRVRCEAVRLGRQRNAAVGLAVALVVLASPSSRRAAESASCQPTRSWRLRVLPGAKGSWISSIRWTGRCFPPEIAAPTFLWSDESAAVDTLDSPGPFPGQRRSAPAHDEHSALAALGGRLGAHQGEVTRLRCRNSSSSASTTSCAGNDLVGGQRPHPYVERRGARFHLLSRSAAALPRKPSRIPPAYAGVSARSTRRPLRRSSFRTCPCAATAIPSRRRARFSASMSTTAMTRVRMPSSR